VSEGALELEAAAADVAEVVAEETEGGRGGDGGAGLVDALGVDEDAAGKDEGLGALARGGEAVIDEKLVEPKLAGRVLFFRARGHRFGRFLG
jgi:hypothetical protein